MRAEVAPLHLDLDLLYIPTEEDDPEDGDGDREGVLRAASGGAPGLEL